MTGNVQEKPFVEEATTKLDEKYLPFKHLKNIRDNEFDVMNLLIKAGLIPRDEQRTILAYFGGYKTPIYDQTGNTVVAYGSSIDYRTKQTIIEASQIQLGGTIPDYWAYLLTTDEALILHRRFGIPFYHEVKEGDKFINEGVIPEIKIEDGKVYDLSKLADLAEYNVLKNADYYIAKSEESRSNQHYYWSSFSERKLKVEKVFNVQKDAFKVYSESDAARKRMYATIHAYENLNSFDSISASSEDVDFYLMPLIGSQEDAEKIVSISKRTESEKIAQFYVYLLILSNCIIENRGIYKVNTEKIDISAEYAEIEGANDLNSLINLFKATGKKTVAISKLIEQAKKI